jgi:O-antigen/teichoic acid export membrane protein
MARNLSTRYLAIAVEIALGLATLPFNLAHLGKAAYGLWTLTASVTAYFSLLDLGYSGALVKFVAQYRSQRDAESLNEILSTIFYVFTVCSMAAYAVAILLAVFLPRLFQLVPGQVATARIVLLVTSLNVALGITFSVFGAVVNGFQRYDLNNVVGTVSGIVTALVNVVVLAMGFGLVSLVVAITAVRVCTYWVYRANAYRVFQDLRISPSCFRRARLREVTSFSVHVAVIDWANRVNYSMDAVIIGAFMNTTAVAVWAIGQRLAELTQRLASQLNDMLFPAVVANNTAARLDRLQGIFIQGTRLSLAAVVPMAGGMLLLADLLVGAWVGPDFNASVAVLQLLSLLVIVRVGSATASTLLKGAGEHRLVASANTVAAIVNATLSIALVKPFALIGVAVGTLIPVCLALTLVVFPAGCRRVGLTVAQGFGRAVWPALWPAGVMTVYVVLTKPLVPGGLVAVAAEFAATTLVYATTFVLFGLSVTERQFYIGRVFAIAERGVSRLSSESA